MAERVDHSITKTVLVCLRERKKEVTFVAETMRTIEKHYWMKHLRFMVMCLAQPLVGKTLILIYNLKRGVGGAI